MQPGIAIRFKLEDGATAWLVADDATRDGLQTTGSITGAIMTVPEVREIAKVRELFPGGPMRVEGPRRR